MSIARNPQDPWIEEMQKWETRPVILNGTLIEPIPLESGGRGGAPRTEYPKMLYRAEAESGGYRISGTKIVPDEGAERIAIGQGWSVTQEDALAQGPARALEIATLAANRAHNDRWMSEAARAEAASVDESTMQHLPSIPETPIRRGPGRPPKETR
jgi:hypothetical protein